MSTELISDERLRIAIRSAARMSKKDHSRDLLWVFVGRLFGLGSTSSTMICLQLKLDPNATVGQIAKS